MKRFWLLIPSSLCTVLLCASLATAQWQTVWELGAPGRGWPQDQGGVIFVQEANVNPPPGDPMSPAVNQQADDDYYVAGTYPAPIGTVPDELVAERAFAGTDNDLRFHFNLPDTLNAGDKFRFSYEANNLHEDAATVPDPRYGIEVLVNDNLVFAETVITPADLNTVFTSAEFTAGDVGLAGGAGQDNVVWVRGVNYNAEGGGNWMGIDYHHLEVNPVPEPGALGMMFSGLIWSIPLLLYERAKALKFMA